MPLSWGIYKTKGFSLVEMLIAVSLIVITLLSYFMILRTVSASRFAQRQSVAYQIALKKVEELKSLPFASLPASGSFNDSALSVLPQAVANLIINNFSGSDKLKDIKVEISWLDTSGQKKVEIQTLLTEGGI